ncbi:hypothetical protein [Polaribacter sp. R77954]|uniref:hypothetical protein n=1 Tax=Polaribacter sp. R77954 TaxID=3093870 RepID=UPI0037C90E74
MNNQDFVNFRQVRSLGDILSDTFKFLKSEWQPFFITIVKIAIVPVIIAIAAAIYFLIESSYFYSGVLNINQNEPDFNFNFSSIFLPLTAIIASYIIAYALVTVASLSYIKSYIKNKGIVNYDEIQTDTKEQFWPYVGLFFLAGLIILVGTLFCFLPGIYFWVVLSLSIPILIYQNKGVADSISDAFTLIKDNWWETFGILIVVQILIIIASFVVELPISLYQGVDMTALLEDENPADLFEYFRDPVYLVLLGISYLVKFVLYIISTIVTVFIYFDIREQKNPTSDGIIDEIGMN